ncbi:hypothetical protein [Streptomyces sp. bgisy091]|uniref:hypothetical protein n=1 Tax=Streptomyces sp. bgisy091 TaxID=3413778 RepID=UPI003D740ED7
MSLTPSKREAGRSRGLAKLAGLEPAEEDLALYLRGLHAQLGMLSKELAVALTEEQPGQPVSAFQLSRYMGGKALPQLSLLSGLHRLLAKRTGRPYDDSAVRHGRELVFAAAQAKGPLMAREVRLEAALEDLGSQRARTAEELSRLRHGLAEEKQRLADLQRDLGGLVEKDRREQRETTDEREETQRRIAALEDLVRQHEALLRLMQQEAFHVESMVKATGREVELWHRREPFPATSSIAAQGGPAATADAIIERRDEGNDVAADDLIIQYAVTAAPDDLAALSWEFGTGRPLEDDRLMRAVAVYRSASVISGLSAGGPKSRDIRHGDRLLHLAGEHAPVAEVIHLIKLLHETGQEGRLKVLANGARNRAKEQREQLISAGLSLPRPNKAEPGKRRLWK